ncbi:unnamed protein product, partial [Protopolystoma xenopodis]
RDFGVFFDIGVGVDVSVAAVHHVVREVAPHVKAWQPIGVNALLDGGGSRDERILRKSPDQIITVHSLRRHLSSRSPTGLIPSLLAEFSVSHLLARKLLSSLGSVRKCCMPRRRIGSQDKLATTLFMSSSDFRGKMNIGTVHVLPDRETCSRGDEGETNEELGGGQSRAVKTPKGGRRRTRGLRSRRLPQLGTTSPSDQTLKVSLRSSSTKAASAKSMFRHRGIDIFAGCPVKHSKHVRQSCILSDDVDSAICFHSLSSIKAKLLRERGKWGKRRFRPLGWARSTSLASSLLPPGGTIVPSVQDVGLWTWYMPRRFGGIVSTSCHSQHHTTIRQRPTFCRNGRAITRLYVLNPLVPLSPYREFTLASSHLLSSLPPPFRVADPTRTSCPRLLHGL